MVLISRFLTFTGNNVKPKSDYPLLQSMLKLFSLFKIQVQLDGDEIL